MLYRKWLGIGSLLLCLMFPAGKANAESGIQKYLNDAAQSIHATADPVQKRAVLDEQYVRLSDGMNMLIESGMLSSGDRTALSQESARLNEMRDELAGRNGFARVPDNQIDQFARFVVQDQEQADTVIIISSVTLLLLLILIVLIVR